MTKEQKFEAEYKIYNSGKEFIDMYENGDEFCKEFMLRVTLMTPEQLEDYKKRLEKEVPEFFGKRKEF